MAVPFKKKLAIHISGKTSFIQKSLKNNSPGNRMTKSTSDEGGRQTALLNSDYKKWTRQATAIQCKAEELKVVKWLILNTHGTAIQDEAFTAQELAKEYIATVPIV